MAALFRQWRGKAAVGMGGAALREAKRSQGARRRGVFPTMRLSTILTSKLTPGCYTPSPDPGAGEPSSLSPSRRQSPAPSAVSPSPRLFWSGKGPPPSPSAGHRATPPPGAHNDRAGRRARVRVEHATGRPSRGAGDRTAVRAHPAPSACTRSSRGAQEAQQDGGLHMRSGGGGGEHEPDDDGEQRVAMAQRGGRAGYGLAAAAQKGREGRWRGR
ncbi:skin secretory protein xP2-like [Panicum virgatum]|uniref:skin secretory protein xP2-like n=1 Tax=Panicum virgatum TaxID=38727 RepID=UPI0019D579AC|nr:skin secretory protein xP2-like [Panicum virgatum]